MGSRPLKSTHGKGRFAANINTGARAKARAALDKPAAVNYEWACGEGDRLVNMQRRRKGLESTQHKCQNPTARGQAGVDPGVNHRRRQGNAWKRTKSCGLTPADWFCFNERAVKR